MKRIASLTTISELSPLINFGRAAVARERRIQLEEVVVRNPFVKSHRAGVGGRTGFDRADMPFAKVAAAVAGLTEKVRDRDFLRAEATSPARRCPCDSDGVR